MMGVREVNVDAICILESIFWQYFYRLRDAVTLLLH